MSSKRKATGVSCEQSEKKSKVSREKEPILEQDNNKRNRAETEASEKDKKHEDQDEPESRKAKEDQVNDKEKKGDEEEDKEEQDEEEDDKEDKEEQDKEEDEEEQDEEEYDEEEDIRKERRKHIFIVEYQDFPRKTIGSAFFPLYMLSRSYQQWLQDNTVPRHDNRFLCSSLCSSLPEDKKAQDLYNWISNLSLYHLKDNTAENSLNIDVIYEWNVIQKDPSASILVPKDHEDKKGDDADRILVLYNDYSTMKLVRYLLPVSAFSKEQLEFMSSHPDFTCNDAYDHPEWSKIFKSIKEGIIDKCSIQQKVTSFDFGGHPPKFTWTYTVYGS